MSKTYNEIVSLFIELITLKLYCTLYYSLGVAVGQTVLVRSLGSIYCLQPTVCELN